MPRLSPPSPALNRLRAAAGLIPLIEDGITHSRIDVKRAATMTAFCEWAANHELAGDPEAERLTADVKSGLERLRPVLAKAA